MDTYSVATPCRQISGFADDTEGMSHDEPVQARCLVSGSRRPVAICKAMRR